MLKNEPRAASIEVTSDQLKVMMLDRKSFNRMLGPIDEILMVEEMSNEEAQT